MLDYTLGDLCGRKAWKLRFWYSVDRDWRPEIESVPNHQLPQIDQNTCGRRTSSQPFQRLFVPIRKYSCFFERSLRLQPLLFCARLGRLSHASSLRKPIEIVLAVFHETRLASFLRSWKQSHRHNLCLNDSKSGENQRLNPKSNGSSKQSERSFAKVERRGGETPERGAWIHPRNQPVEPFVGKVWRREKQNKAHLGDQRMLILLRSCLGSSLRSLERVESSHDANVNLPEIPKECHPSRARKSADTPFASIYPADFVCKSIGENVDL